MYVRTHARTYIRTYVRTINRSIYRLVRSIRSIGYLENCENLKTPLLEEFGVVRDSLKSETDSNESWDDKINLAKRGAFNSSIFSKVVSIDSIFISIRSILRPRVVVDRHVRSFVRSLFQSFVCLFCLFVRSFFQFLSQPPPRWGPWP